MEPQPAPEIVSYAQEFAQDEIRPELLEQLLATCPKLKQLVFRLQNPLRYGRTIPTKLLLVGPPGVGKTTIAKGIASLINRPYIFLRASLLTNEYKNSGPQNLAREIIPILQSGQPYVIIVDELHALTENYKKDHNADPGTAEALWSILDECAKNPQVLFIGTTNDAVKLPEPLKTRFANGIIEIPLPNLEQRTNIIKYYLHNISYTFDRSYFTTLAKQTNQLSGRNLEQLVSDAITYALDREEIPMIRKKDFERALKDMNENQSSLALLGWEKHKQFLKDNATTIATIIGIGVSLVGLAMQYWSMQRQISLQLVAQNAQIDQNKKFLDHQVKVQNEQFTIEQGNKEKKANQSAFIQKTGAGAGIVTGAFTLAASFPPLWPVAYVIGGSGALMAADAFDQNWSKM